MVALVCARGGNMPADCSQSPLIGRWAGKRVLVQGDYAEDGDIANWDGPPLSALYRAMRPLDERETWDDMPKGYWDVPVFADISADACAFLEATCNVRYFDQKHQVKDQTGKIVDTYASTHFVKVKPTGKHFGNCGVAEYVIDDCYTTDDLAWLKRRCGLQPIDIQRVPRSGDWHGIRPDEIPEGQRRVIVNLDSLEYLDPIKFGQEPTLAGMLADRGPPPWPKLFEKADPGGVIGIDVAGALFAMLCHQRGVAAAICPPIALSAGGKPSRFRRFPSRNQRRLIARREEA